MLFVIYAKDKAGALDVRKATRPSHLDFIAQSGETVKIAGALLAADGETSMGSVLIVDFETLEGAQQWAALDPYARAGLFESVEIHPWKWVIGAPEESI